MTGSEQIISFLDIAESKSALDYVNYIYKEKVFINGLFLLIIMCLFFYFNKKDLLVVILFLIVFTIGFHYMLNERF